MTQRRVDVEELNDLEQRLAQVVSHTRSILNAARSPASKLPAELLSQIFACLRTPEVPTRDHPLEDMWGAFNESLATVNLVCRYWRQAAKGAKDLWTHIAAVDAPDLRQLRLMFELFVERSASFPLSLTVPRTDDWEHYTLTFAKMEPHVHRLQTLTIGRPGIDPSNAGFFFQPAPLLKELRMVCLPDVKTLPEVFGGSVPLLRTLDLVGCMPGSTNRFTNLSTLSLGPSKIGNFNDVLLMLEGSPCLEHLYLHQDLAPGQPRAIILRESAKLDHLKTLSLWRFTAEEIIALLHSVTLPQHGLAMRFVDIRSEDSTFARIYPLDIPPHLSIFAATRLEVLITQLYCAFHAVGDHSATAVQWHSNGPYLSTSAVMRHVAQGPFNQVRELWMPVHPGGVNIPLEFPALEFLVLGRERSLALGFSRMLAPRGEKVPSPRIETIEIHGCVDLVIVAEFATVFHDRANAGRRLKKLRMKDRETCLVPLEHEVDELEFLGELGGGMELPEICEMDLGERWLSWRRDPSDHLAWYWPSVLPEE
ncbi:hypothetical protein BJ322DRAFT_1085853 [Thelephora terrestris]|uniref:F-box domain-containing protein n=1 Tax=Thelephora terrestris TaxID=56493 RepID=A0A9P6H670_9AGAM|nr:hypothetical protein BJ322DRAFT_1085853 [Thelephora terrestris]